VYDITSHAYANKNWKCDKQTNVAPNFKKEINEPVGDVDVTPAVVVLLVVQKTWGDGVTTPDVVGGDVPVVVPVVPGVLVGNVGE